MKDVSFGFFVHNSNCFISRYVVDPERREEFLETVIKLFQFAANWYEEGCNFAFQGWARNPDQWVAIASWKSEDILARLRKTPEFIEYSTAMLGFCTAPMIMEQFSGMAMPRTVFDLYPAGSSAVHTRSGNLEVLFI